MKKLALLFLLFSQLDSYAQKEGQTLIDSLLFELPKSKPDSSRVNLLNEIAFNYQYIDPATGHKYARQALDLSRKIRWNDGIATSYRNIGVNHSVDSDYEKALENYEAAMKATKNKKIISKILRGTGLIYTYQSNYQKAIDYDMRALKMSEEVNDQKGIAAVLSNIGIVYYDLKDFRKAIAFYEKARTINKKMGNDVYLSNNLGNLGNAYSELQQYDKANSYYKQAIVINDKLGDLNNKTINLNTLATNYAKKKDFKIALLYANESLALAEKIKDERLIGVNHGILGDVYAGMALKTSTSNEREPLLRKSKEHLNIALKFMLRLGNWKELAYNYGQLSDIELMHGNADNALKLYKLSIRYKDSVFNADTKETVKSLEDKRSIELRDKEIELNKATLQAQKKEKWLYLFGITFLLITAALILMQSRSRKKTNQKLQLLNAELDDANKVKARFFSILNHDLRSPVSSLISFLHLQKESPELLTEESRKRMETKTISSAENLLESMEDILLWSKGQMENFKPHPANFKVDTIFEDLRKHFSNIETVKIQWENPESLSLFSDENYLKTILRNLIGNAIKALEKTDNATILVKASVEKSETFITVSDNGPGGTIQQFRALYDEKEVIGIQSGLGLHLIRDLAKAINCKITVDSKPNFGTTFTLELP